MRRSTGVAGRNSWLCTGAVVLLALAGTSRAEDGGSADAGPTDAGPTYQLEDIVEIRALRPRMHDEVDPRPLTEPAVACPPKPGKKGGEAPPPPKPGKKGGEAPPPPKTRQTSSTVDRNALIEVTFPHLECWAFTGGITVRARILRETPVELPVDNYVVITDDALVSRRRSTVPSVLGAVFSDEVVEAYNTLFARYREHVANWKALEKARDDWDNASKKAETARTELNTDETALASAKKADKVSAQAKVERAREVFKEAATERRNHLEAFAAAATRYVTLARTLDAARLTLVEGISPGHHAGRLLLLDTRTSELRSDLHKSLATIAENVPHAFAPWANTLTDCLDKQADAMACVSEAGGLADGIEAAFGAEGQPISRDPTQKANLTQMDKVFDDLLNAMRAFAEKLSASVRADAIKRIPPARVHLYQADLEHGERIEIIITSRLTAADRASMSTWIDPDDVGEELTESVVRMVFRVADLGWSSSVNPQFVLVSEGWQEQFTPAPGVALEFRYRWRAQWTDWLVPSAALSLHALTEVDADDETSMILGVAGGLGWLNGLVHIGYGRRLDDSTDEYWYLAFDFANGIGVFQQTRTGGDGQ